MHRVCAGAGTRCRLVPLLGNHELMLLDALQNPRVHRPVAGVRRRRDACAATTAGSATSRPSTWSSSAAASATTRSPTHFFVHANYAADIRSTSSPTICCSGSTCTFTLPPPHENGKIAIVGHTSQKTGEIFDQGHVICIDTFCHGGGWLTAMDVGSRSKIWQADRQGRSAMTIAGSKLVPEQRIDDHSASVLGLRSSPWRSCASPQLQACSSPNHCRRSSRSSSGRCRSIRRFCRRRWRATRTMPSGRSCGEYGGAGLLATEMVSARGFVWMDAERGRASRAAVGREGRAAAAGRADVGQRPGDAGQGRRAAGQRISGQRRRYQLRLPGAAT